MSLSPDGKRLVVGSSAGFIYLLEAETLELIIEKEHSRYPASSVSWSPLGDLIAVSQGYQFMLLCASSLDIVRSVNIGPEVVPNLCEFSPCGTQVAVGSRRGGLYVYDATSSELMHNFFPEQIDNRVMMVRCIAWHPTESGLLAIGLGTSVQMCRTNGERLALLSRANPTDYLLALTFSPHGHLVTFSEGRTLEVWDVSGTEFVPLAKISCPITAYTFDTALAFRPDGQSLFWATEVAGEGALRSIQTPWARRPSSLQQLCVNFINAEQIEADSLPEHLVTLVETGGLTCYR